MGLGGFGTLRVVSPRGGHTCFTVPRHCPGPGPDEGVCVCDTGPLQSLRESPTPKRVWDMSVRTDPPAGLREVCTNGRNGTVDWILLTLFKTSF